MINEKGEYICELCKMFIHEVNLDKRVDNNNKEHHYHYMCTDIKEKEIRDLASALKETTQQTDEERYKAMMQKGLQSLIMIMVVCFILGMIMGKIFF